MTPYPHHSAIEQARARLWVLRGMRALEAEAERRRKAAEAEALASIGGE